MADRGSGPRRTLIRIYHPALPSGQWSPDFLAEHLRARPLALPDNAQGKALATLVHHNPPSRSPARFAVLYVHGWSDYFYNLEMAEFFTRAGAEFYAVDMHGVGRSLRPHQIAGYVSDLREYYPDLDAAASYIRDAHPGLPLVVVAHSQGALTTSLWLKDHEHSGAAHPRVAGLILNAPWLELPYTPLLRRILTPIARAWSLLSPQAHIPIASPRFYERTISADFEGEWPINDQWRIDPDHPAHPAWARAILEAQRTIARGLDLRLPIFTLTSDRSLIQPVWSDDMWHRDVITDVEQTWRRLPSLGRDVTLVKVRGAVHDVLLSAKPVRRKAYDHLGDWLARQPTLGA